MVSTPAIHLSADGRLWQPISEILADDVDEVTGLVASSDGFVVVTMYSPPASGIECLDVELSSYRSYVADASD